LVHLYQTSSLLPGHLSRLASASLRLLYSLLYSGHVNHFQFLGFLPFPYSSCMCSPLSVCGEWIMRSLWEPDISIVVLNDLQAEFVWPQPQKRVRGKMQHSCFS
jgi:hypothetical protein